MPLPKPTSELASTVIFNSDTATLPHPIRQTITTPPSSRSKGDWGLKRPLPLRSTTKTSTPYIRVDTIDTIEHITEYASAADHTLTLQKWQELNMPLSTPGVRDDQLGFLSNRRTGIKGVFEEDVDATPDLSQTDNRWKFSGPWLAGLTEGEFDDYVRKIVRGRRAEFQAFLKQNKAAEETKKAQRQAEEKGEDAPAPVRVEDITEDHMRSYFRELRQDRFNLFNLIRQFLDLPPAPSPKGFLGALEDVMESITTGPNSKKVHTLDSKDLFNKASSPYAETGPPKTHPSAGLSYLRSKAYVYNHPVYGPQEKPAPVQGRVIQPKSPSIGSLIPKLGVAGVVTNVPSGEGFNTSRSRPGQLRRETHPGLANIEPNKVGGSKIYLQPTHANIDQNGRIHLEVAGGDGPARAILQGTENDVYTEGRRPVRGTRPNNLTPGASPFNYGLGSKVSNRGGAKKPAGATDPADAMKTLQSLLS